MKRKVAGWPFAVGMALMLLGGVPGSAVYVAWGATVVGSIITALTFLFSVDQYSATWYNGYASGVESNQYYRSRYYQQYGLREKLQTEYERRGRRIQALANENAALRRELGALTAKEDA